MTETLEEKNVTKEEVFIEVLNNVRDLFEKYANSNLVEIFDKYLNESFDLDKLNDDILEYITEIWPSYDAGLTKTWDIVVKGHQIPLHQIFSLTLEDKYSYQKNMPEYRLIINKTDSKITIANVLLVFDTDEERQKEIEKINNLRSICSNLRIINKYK